MSSENSTFSPDEFYLDKEGLHLQEHPELNTDELNPVFSVLYSLREFEGNTGKLIGKEFAKKEYEIMHEHGKLMIVHVGIPASAKTLITSQDAYLLDKLLDDDPKDVKIQGVKGNYLVWGDYLMEYLGVTHEQLEGNVDENLKGASEEFVRQVLRLSEIDNMITYVEAPGVAGRAEEVLDVLADKPFALFRAVYTDDSKRQEYIKFREQIQNTDPHDGPVIESIDQFKKLLELHGMHIDSDLDFHFLELMRSSGAPLNRTKKLDRDLNFEIAELMHQTSSIKISKEKIIRLLENDPEFRTSTIASYFEYLFSTKYKIPSERRVVQENVHQEEVALLTDKLQKIKVKIGPGGILEL